MTLISRTSLAKAAREPYREAERKLTIMINGWESLGWEQNDKNVDNLDKLKIRYKLFFSYAFITNFNMFY